MAGATSGPAVAVTVRTAFSRFDRKERVLTMDSPIGAKGADNPPSAAAKPQGAARRASAEEILAKSEHRFWVAFENSMTGMLFDDLEGGALEVNDAFCDMVGRTRDELIGKDMG